MTKTVVLHLVCHASGELIEMLARNAIAQPEGLQADRRLWKMVRRMGQIPEIPTVAHAPGYVLHSSSHADLRQAQAANVPLVPGVPLPVWLSQAQAPLIVGLTVDWPVIDVTQRSIEQTASQIIDMLAARAAGPR